jgi:UPF0042 nucleotide-binding protein
MAPCAGTRGRIVLSCLRTIARSSWLRCVRSKTFGWKTGPPSDADFVFDARFLPNPHYDSQLRPQTGSDPAVRDFLQRETEAELYVEDIQRFLQRWLPKFVLDQRASLTVAIGCTGGRHRSVFVAHQLAERFASEYQVVLRHRDLKD